MNVFEGLYRNDLVEALGARWPVSGARATEGQRVNYGIRPEHLDLAPSGIPAEVVVVEPMGAETELLVKVGEGAAGQTLTLMTHGRSSIGPGERAFLAPRLEHVHLFDAATGARL